MTRGEEAELDDNAGEGFGDFTRKREDNILPYGDAVKNVQKCEAVFYTLVLQNIDITAQKVYN